MQVKGFLKKKENCSLQDFIYILYIIYYILYIYSFYLTFYLPIEFLFCNTEMLTRDAQKAETEF